MLAQNAEERARAVPEGDMAAIHMCDAIAAQARGAADDEHQSGAPSRKRKRADTEILAAGMWASLHPHILVIAFTRSMMQQPEPFQDSFLGREGDDDRVRPDMCSYI